MAEERAEVDVLVAVEVGPGVGAREPIPRRLVAGERGRAEREDVEEHRLIVALVLGSTIPNLWPPRHRGERRVLVEPVPLDALVERVGVGADGRLVGSAPVEILAREEHAAHQQRRVDRGQLYAPEALAGFLVEEMVEEALVAGHAGLARALRGLPEKAERGQRALGRLGARDVAALGADAVARQPKPDGGDAGERLRRPAVGDEAVLGVRRFPEPVERPLLQRVEKQHVVVHRRHRRFDDRGLDHRRRRAS